MDTTIHTHRTGKTPEERKAQAEALHDSISTQVQALCDSDQWMRFLDFAQTFHSYSLNNVLLILAQRPDASQVAGFRTWQTLGRQVRKGEKGIKIFGYSTKKITEEDDNGDPQETRIPRFPILSVFDISQTDPVDGYEGPATLTEQLTGTDDFGIISTLTDHLATAGWTVDHHPISGSKNGYADPTVKGVVLDSALSPEHSAKTLIHETAHILLNHTDNITEYAAHRGLMETEAESVAYIVAGLAGFDTSAYSIGYIAGWTDGDTQLVKATAARVLNTAHAIADTLDSGYSGT
jgi:antirestriction protein ArdC